MRTYDDWKTTDDSYEWMDRCEECGHAIPGYCDCSCCFEKPEPAETIEEMAESIEGAIANGWEGWAYLWTCDLARAAFRAVPELRGEPVK
jgi:hypothetical protein